jgi:DNA-binding transcriptional regulator YhcF (GntR family)
MKQKLDNDRPLFLQVKEAIEEDILNGLLKPGEQIPSNSQLVSFFSINPVTVHNGVSLLLEEGIVFKRRGLGMFVSDDAPAIIRRRYQKSFRQDYVQPLAQRAVTLGLAADELHSLIDESLQQYLTDPPQAMPKQKPEASLSDSMLGSTKADLRGD